MPTLVHRSQSFAFFFSLLSYNPDSCSLILQILFRIGERANVQRAKHAFVLLVFSNVSKFGCGHISPFFQNGTAVAMAMTNTHHWFLLLYFSACGLAIVVGGYLFLRVFLSAFFFVLLRILFLPLFSINFLFCVFYLKQKDTQIRYNASQWLRLCCFGCKNRLHLVFFRCILLRFASIIIKLAVCVVAFSHFFCCCLCHLCHCHCCRYRKKTA